jgi:hypothetical protein
MLGAPPPPAMPQPLWPRRHLASLPLLLALIAPVPLLEAPSLAKTVNGTPSSGGLYWQKVESGGKVQYLCRSTKEPGIQKGARCQGAKAKKP